MAFRAYLPIYPSVCLSVRPSIHISIYLSIYLSIYIYLFIYLSIYAYIHAYRPHVILSVHTFKYNAFYFTVESIETSVLPVHSLELYYKYYNYFSYSAIRAILFFSVSHNNYFYSNRLGPFVQGISGSHAGVSSPGVQSPVFPILPGSNPRLHDLRWFRPRWSRRLSG